MPQSNQVIFQMENFAAHLIHQQSGVGVASVERCVDRLLRDRFSIVAVDSHQRSRVEMSNRRQLPVPHSAIPSKVSLAPLRCNTTDSALLSLTQVSGREIKHG